MARPLPPPLNGTEIKKQTKNFLLRLPLFILYSKWSEVAFIIHINWIIRDKILKKEKNTLKLQGMINAI